MVALLLSTNYPFLHPFVKIYYGKVQKIELNGEFLNAQWADGMCANLQILEMTGINWLPNEMSFMKLILSKARLLRTLCISHHDDCSVSHVDPLHELVTCGKASAQAQVLFKGKKFHFTLHNSIFCVLFEPNGFPCLIFRFLKVSSAHIIYF